jgi:protein TonB
MKYLSFLLLLFCLCGNAQTNSDETSHTPQKRYDGPGNKTEIYTTVEEMAEFPGGTVAMTKFIQDNLVYPASAKKNKIGGKCFLKFVVNIQGTIEQVEVLKGVTDCKECDEEGVRVIKLMPVWKPAKINGKAVPSYFNLPLNFRP